MLANQSLSFLREASKKLASFPRILVLKCKIPSTTDLFNQYITLPVKQYAQPLNTGLLISISAILFEWLCCISTSYLLCEIAREWESLSWIILLKAEWGLRLPWAFCWFSTCKFDLRPCLIYLLCYCGACIHSLCVLHVFQFCISNFSMQAINHSHIYFQTSYIIFNLYIKLC